MNKSLSPILLQDGFLDCVNECINDAHFVAQFDRLRDCNLAECLASGERLSDEGMEKFARFVDEFVYQPMATKYREGAA